MIFFCIFKKSLCSSYAFLMHILCNSFAFLMQFFCISYAILLQFLCISYAFLMHFLCSSYAVLKTSYTFAKTAYTFAQNVCYILQVIFSGKIIVNSRIILQMSRSTTTVFEAVQKPHSMCFGVETLDYASLMNVLYPIKHGKQGWHNGDSARLPPMCPDLIQGPGVICGLSLLLVLALAPRVFLRVLQFSSLLKNQHF